MIWFFSLMGFVNLVVSVALAAYLVESNSARAAAVRAVFLVAWAVLFPFILAYFSPQ